MIEGVVIKSLKKYNDNRGYLTEIWRSDELEHKPEMSYISLTLPGVVRGPHEHRYQADCFIFIGPGDFDLHLWDRREESSTFKQYEKIRAGESEPLLVVVPPGVVHGYKCVSKEPALSINLPDKLYKGKDKKEEVDEIRWEQDKNSPYRIE
ncbi:MAG: dTDP-4-dehydrorhamnose 3,5-epimerase family protein [Candidatus Pacebacteria bacterium]|nr:dTDP-4-dehydrorhamnose 3,5-epimerase family protein [Candidatus Paceibacterota bacterium]